MSWCNTLSCTAFVVCAAVCRSSTGRSSAQSCSTHSSRCRAPAWTPPRRCHRASTPSSQTTRPPSRGSTRPHIGRRCSCGAFTFGRCFGIALEPYFAVVAQWPLCLFWLLDISVPGGICLRFWLEPTSACAASPCTGGAPSLSNPNPSAPLSSLPRALPTGCGYLLWSCTTRRRRPRAGKTGPSLAARSSEAIWTPKPVR